MFSPGTKRPNANPRRDPASPATPLTEIRRASPDNSVPNRPSTGTPAPWAPRLSVITRVLPGNQNEKGDEIKPVYVAEFPQVVRDEQASMLQRLVHGDASLSDGMERGTSLAWIICSSRLFVWSFLSPALSANCTILKIPGSVFEGGEVRRSGGNSWLLRFVSWDNASTRMKKIG